jgi:hypothetical protein
VYSRVVFLDEVGKVLPIKMPSIILEIFIGCLLIKVTILKKGFFNRASIRASNMYLAP